MADQVRVFVSYSHEDKSWVEKGKFGLIPWLIKSLKEDNVTFWYDRNLLPGYNFEKEIKSEINQADFAMLLISQDFLNSDFIRNIELPIIKEKVERDEMCLIPILVGPVIWEEKGKLSWIFARQMLPGSPTPLIEYTGDIIKWQNVRIEILKALKKRIETWSPEKEEEKTPQSEEEAVELKIDSIQNIVSNPNKTKAAEEKLKEIINEFPDCARSYYHLGKLYNERGNHKKAIEIYKKGIKKTDDDALLYWGLTMAFLNQNDNKSATESIKKAIDIGLKPHLKKRAEALLNALQKKDN